MEELEKVTFDIVNKKKFDIALFYKDYKELIYSVIFYLIGLILGSYFYVISDADIVNEILTDIIKNFTLALTANLLIYILIFILIILMGFSIIGFSLINSIPVFIGIYYGLKGACYFTLYNAKGIGYIILLIAPVAALLITVTLFSISYNSKLSKAIFDSTKGIKSRGSVISLKPLLIQIIIQLVLFIALSVINAGFSVALGNLITI